VHDREKLPVATKTFLRPFSNKIKKTKQRHKNQKKKLIQLKKKI
jgi:hypothetical protein